jgi:hypothetical protein
MAELAGSYCSSSLLCSGKQAGQAPSGGLPSAQALMLYECNEGDFRIQQTRSAADSVDRHIGARTGKKNPQLVHQDTKHTEYACTYP